MTCQGPEAVSLTDPEALEAVSIVSHCAGHGAAVLGGPKEGHAPACGLSPLCEQNALPGFSGAQRPCDFQIPKACPWVGRGYLGLLWSYVTYAICVHICVSVPPPLSRPFLQPCIHHVPATLIFCLVLVCSLLPPIFSPAGTQLRQPLLRDVFPHPHRSRALVYLCHGI